MVLDEAPPLEVGAIEFVDEVDVKIPIGIGLSVGFAFATGAQETKAIAIKFITSFFILFDLLFVSVSPAT